MTRHSTKPKRGFGYYVVRKAIGEAFGELSPSQVKRLEMAILSASDVTYDEIGRRFGMTRQRVAMHLGKLERELKLQDSHRLKRSTEPSQRGT